MIISILAFSYSIGKEIKLVDATDANSDECAGKVGEELCKCKGGIASPQDASCKGEILESLGLQLVDNLIKYNFKCCKTAYCKENYCKYTNGTTCQLDNGCCKDWLGKFYPPVH